MPPRMIPLANGLLMPSVGLGTWQHRDAVVLKQVVLRALDAGYRLIDTASAYRNEAIIGETLAMAFNDKTRTLRREDVWITSKLAPKQQGYDGATAAVLESLKCLQVEYIDLYLIHWPGASGKTPGSHEHRALREGSWKALEDLYRQKKVRAIGVSNYTKRHLEEMRQYAEIKPMVNQCEFHPLAQQAELLQYCRENDIVFMAYASLGESALLADDSGIEQLNAICSRRPDLTRAQILLLWGLQHGAVVIPKATSAKHLQENIAAASSTLSADEMTVLDDIGKQPERRFCWNAANPPQEPPFDPLYFYHYGSRQEFLREITGFFPRVRARLRRALKGSYQKRPWTVDDVFALATWVIMSQAMMLLIGTTTTVSVILWTLNRLQYQDWIAHKLSDWVSSALGVTVSFESAIVPAWRRGAIRLKNVKIYCGPEHGALLDNGDQDTNFTSYMLQIDQIDVTLSLWRWMDDRGLIRECSMRGVRGVVDRRQVWWDPKVLYSPSEFRRARLPGIFDLDSLDIEDMLLTVHPWQNFRPITVSIYSASLPRFRDRWLLYDTLNANSVVGMYDGSLFTIHQAHQHMPPHSLAMHTTGIYGFETRPKGDQRVEDVHSTLALPAEAVEARTTHVQVEGLNIDHINSGVDGPVSWITSGRLNVSALVSFPTQPSASDPAMAIRKIVDNINDSIDVVILPSMPDWSNPEKSPNSLVRVLYHLDMVDSPLAQEMHDRLRRRAERESQHRLEKQRQRTASWSQPLAPIPSHLIGSIPQHSVETLPRTLEDPTAVHVDLQVEFNDIRTTVPLSMPALGYPLLSAVLVRPIVAYMNAHRTSLPMRCQLRLRLEDFDGAWSFWDSGADSLITQGIGAAFAQLVHNERERNRQLKLVGWWSVTAIARQCARLADFVYSQRSFFSYLGVAPETDRI
ncbi:Mitochondrial distribution and morphology protein 31, mitochondrial precursor [Coemansia sp. BCRC 34301]|nr:Mitochondrial distribution and morphology protein 31, mitochondrial precursor [Coemansia sp. BCRC 34301]